MPELPDITLYLDALRSRLTGKPLTALRLFSPFVLRSVDPPPTQAEGRRVVALHRLGKRIVIGLEDDLFLVLHLMVAGRLRWRKTGAKPPGRITLAAVDFPDGTLMFTEAGKKKRAALHIVQGTEALAQHDPGGLELLDSDLSSFREALTQENHTLKRALTDPRLFSGIGNAYSDEILHRAKLSPFKQTMKLDEEEIARLHRATREILQEWIARLQQQTGDAFPDSVTAFHDEMAVHGRYKQPCPDCGAPVQRIVYTENEANYCARCQTGGKLLADRAMSRLLRQDWPRTLEELERGLSGSS